MLSERVATRYRCAQLAKTAGSDLWASVVAALTQAASEASALKGAEPDTEEGKRTLLNMVLLGTGKPLASLAENPTFVKWVTLGFPSGQGAATLEQLTALYENAREEAKAVRNGDPVFEFRQAVTAFERVVNDLLAELAPERLTYQGFTVTNYDHMSDAVVRGLLEGVDYVVALFKRRGLEKLLHSGVTEIHLDIENYISDKPSTLGHYRPSQRAIHMYPNGLRIANTPRMLSKWVNEIFLHEFGHYIHLAYLPKEAMEAWNATWDDFKVKCEVFTQATTNISVEERALFWSLLQKNGYQPSKVAPKLKPFLRLKFGAWLRQYYSGPLITAGQFKLTEKGKNFFALFVDPEKYMLEERGYYVDEPGYAKEYQKLERTRLTDIGLVSPSTFPIPNETVEEIKKANPELKAEVSAELDKLQPVSTYGRTDEMEDFAEAFVAFVGAPEKLTHMAKFRMQRALSLAGLYGKEVMKLAQHPEQ